MMGLHWLTPSLFSFFSFFAFFFRYATWQLGLLSNAMDPERLGDAARPFVEDLEPGDARSFAIHSGLGVATPLLDALGMRPGSKKKGRSPGYVSRTQYNNQDTVSSIAS